MHHHALLRRWARKEEFMRCTGKWLVLVVLGGCLVAACSADSAPQDSPRRATTVPLGPNSLGLTFTPMPDWFHFQSSETVQAWINEDDTKSMMEHAWELWGGRTSPTTQTINREKGHLSNL